MKVNYLFLVLLCIPFCVQGMEPKPGSPEFARAVKDKLKAGINNTKDVLQKTHDFTEWAKRVQPNFYAQKFYEDVEEEIKGKIISVKDKERILSQINYLKNRILTSVYFSS